MREYKIKRGYNPDINLLIKELFGVNGDVYEGVRFFAEGIGEVFIKRKGQTLFIETKPSRDRKGDYSIIKKWNDFLFKATGKTAKERRKELMDL